MKLATTTGDFASVYESDIDRLRAVAEAGFKYVDLSLYTGWEFGKRYLAPDWEKRVYALGDEAAKLGVKFVQAHSPDLGCLHPADPELYTAATERSFEVCGLLGIPQSVFHTGCSGEYLLENPGDKQRYFEANRAVLEKLYPVLERTGVNLLIENSTRANMGKRWFFLTGADMKEFIDFCGHPLIHAVWDVGHAAIEGHQYDDIVALGDDLYALHIHDNRGGGDFHQLPLSGETNYDEILNALIDIGYKGCFTFEADNIIASYKRFRRHPELMTHGDRFLETPTELVKQAEKLLYSIGKYILSTYDLFEE